MHNCNCTWRNCILSLTLPFHHYACHYLSLDLVSFPIDYLFSDVILTLSPLHCAVQCSAVLCSAVQCGTVHAVRWSMVQGSAVICSAANSPLDFLTLISAEPKIDLKHYSVSRIWLSKQNTDTNIFGGTFLPIPIDLDWTLLANTNLFNFHFIN